VRVRRDARGVILRKTEQVDGETIGPYPHYESDPGKPRSVGWYLWVDIGMDLADNRDKLPPVEGGYVIRLVIGADDGAAVAYNVHVDWEGDPDLGPEAVLASALEHLAVTRVR
jgi:hypothetical protein